MKGLEKLTPIRLAEALTQKGVISTELITDALYEGRHGGSFAEILIAGGGITEWDLAKLVVEQFQIPFMMAGSYDVSDEVRDAIPREELFRYQIVPLDHFGTVLTVAMPILTSFENLNRLMKVSGTQIFPYVGLISENRKVLTEMFTDFADWLKQDQTARERDLVERGKKAGAKKDGSKSGGSWAEVFDLGDAEVRHSLGG